MASRVARNWVPISEKRSRLVEAFVTISWIKIKLNSNFKITRTMWESALIGYAKLSRVRRILIVPRGFGSGGEGPTRKFFFV